MFDRHHRIMEHYNHLAAADEQEDYVQCYITKK